MLFPLLSTEKTLLDYREERVPAPVCACVFLWALCVFYSSAEGDWQPGKNKAVEMVIMRVQLFSHCSPQTLDIGRNLFFWPVM